MNSRFTSPVLNTNFRLRKTQLVAALLVGLLAVSSVSAQTPPTAEAPPQAKSQQMELLKKTASESLKVIQTRYWNAEEGRYRAGITKGKASTETAFLWDMSVLLSAFAMGIHDDPATYRPLFDQLLKTLEGYWSETGPVPGYSVLPGLEKPDRFYDDNVWVALALCEAYEFTKDQKYLDLAEKTYKFCQSGEDSKLGGGIYWRENGKNEKNACINAPAAVVAFFLYNQTGKEAYLDSANRYMKWMEKLVDPSDGLIWDHILLNNEIQKTKWTYNTALMIRAHLMKAQITKDESEKAKAITLAEAGIKHWFDPKTGYIKDPASFTHHLTDAILDVADAYQLDAMRSKVLSSLTKIASTLRNEEGFFGERWDRKIRANEKLILLYQSSTLRGLLRALK